MKATIALMGNPNSGKSTLFNLLTGARQRVGNYPGITVEKHEGMLHLDTAEAVVVDLPGTYSLTAYTTDELVARNFLLEERPDVVVVVVDATNLERSLYLVTQVMEMGIPLVLALNMMDEVRHKGIRIDIPALSRILGVPVVGMSARSGEGKTELLATLQHVLAHPPQPKPLFISYGPDLDATLARMEPLIAATELGSGRIPARWLAVKYLENDAHILAQGERFPDVHSHLLKMAQELAEHTQKTLSTDPEALVADYRYGYIASALRGVLSWPTEDRYDVSDKIDKVLTNKCAGPLIMLAVIYAMFHITFTLGEIPMGWMETFFGWLGDTLRALLPEGLVASLLVSGIIDGVGGVLSFTPLILIMFFFLAFLEDSGYMARMAYMLDRVFRAFGLHGCSVVPFIVSGGIPGGCAVPGVMAARTLRSPKEKIATVLAAPLFACGAKVPVFLLLAAAFFPESGGTVLFWITLAAWSTALLAGRLLRSTIIRGPSTPFVMELPPYRMPTLRGMLLHTWERVWQYVKKAGTIILAISILVWAAMTFPGLPQERQDHWDAQRQATLAQTWLSPEEQKNALAAIDAAQNQEALRSSLAGRLGTALEPISQWAGFDWRTNIALIGGFAAKEVIVATLGTAYSLGEVDPEDATPLAERLAQDPAWNPWVAAALMAFVLLYSPCFVTVAMIGREIGWGWAVFSMVFNTTLAFLVAVSIRVLGTIL
jgi:ferrous iron transport protein B